jgi:hypothetical protein
VWFPKRRGSLNYYDDATHKDKPLDFAEVVTVLREEGLRVLYAATQYQPPIGWVIGPFNEPLQQYKEKLKKKLGSCGVSKPLFGAEMLNDPRACGSYLFGLPFATVRWALGR